MEEVCTSPAGRGSCLVLSSVQMRPWSAGAEQPPRKSVLGSWRLGCFVLGPDDMDAGGLCPAWVGALEVPGWAKHLLL